MPVANSLYYNNLIIATAMRQGAPEVNAKILAAQAAHETGNFTSNNFIKNNNAFGMAIPEIRKTPYVLKTGSVSAPASEGGFAYAAYASIEDSVKDVMLWLQYNKADWSKIDTPEKYDAFLVSKGYHTAGQTSYTASLRRYYDKIKDLVVKNPKTSIAALIAAILLIAGGVLVYRNRKKLA